MNRHISRRDFLKVSSLALGSLAFSPSFKGFPDDTLTTDMLGVGRVCVREIEIYKEPSYQSDPVGKRYRDQLLSIFEEIIEPDSLPNAPRWYRVSSGYAHSAHIQRVEERHTNTPFNWISEEGRLGEITVPFTQSYRFTKSFGWKPLYRLYYQSAHWATGVEEGPDGQAWYKITDELLHVDYHVPAAHVRIIPPEEVTPISSHVPWEDKRIEVSLNDQTLTAYEKDKVVLHTLISSGIPSLGGTANGIPTATPKGRFNVDVKMPSKHMGDGKLTDDIHAYELPGVPWVCFFHETGVAFHGTYWHHNYGSKMSHGCVNMTVEEAKWLYRWALPEAKPHEWDRRGYGTRVYVG